MKNWIGERFGKLIVTGVYSEKDKDGHSLYSYLCDCGQIGRCRLSSLVRGDTKSCGCGWNKAKNINLNAFRSKDSSALYWAGFLAADGSVNNRGGCSLQLQLGDSHHLEKFKKWLNIDNEIGYTKPNSKYNRSLNLTVKSSGSAYIHFTSKDVIQDLAEYGITPNKSLTYSPPDFCCESADFWRGMVDGDGTIGKKPYIMLVGTKQTCDGFKKFVSKICDSRASVLPRVNIYGVCFTGIYAEPILKQLYFNKPEFFLERKLTRAKKLCTFE